jgi:hypothetical protein
VGGLSFLQSHLLGSSKKKKERPSSLVNKD